MDRDQLQCLGLDTRYNSNWTSVQMVWYYIYIGPKLSMYNTAGKWKENQRSGTLSKCDRSKRRMESGVGGRPKSSIWSCVVREKNKDGVEIIRCRWCPAEYCGTTSAYRLVDHVAQCSKAPEDAMDFARGLQASRGTKPGCGKGAALRLQFPAWGLEAFTNKEKQKELSECEAELFFANNMALAIADDFFYRKYMKALRPTFNPPCTQTLRHTWLLRKAAEAESARVELVRNAPVVCLSVDGWTSIRKQQVLHFVVCMPEPVLWKSVDVDTCDAAYISGKLLECIGEMCPDTTVASLVTDNASCMLKAWRLLQRPKLLAFGCAAHTLHLFMKDVTSRLATFQEAVEGAVTIARTLKSSSKLRGRLRRTQKMIYGKAMALHLPGKTRWLSIYMTLGSVLRSK